MKYGYVRREALLAVVAVAFAAAMVAVGLMTRTVEAPAPSTAPPPEATAPPFAPAAPAMRSAAPEDEPPSPTPPNDALEQALEAYRQHEAELDAEVSQYRASRPVFAHFLQVFRREMLPLMLKGETAEQRLALQRPELPQDAGVDAFAEEEAWVVAHRPYYYAILGPLLAEVGAEVYSLAVSEDGRASEEDAAVLAEVVTALQQASGEDGASLRGNPYAPGSLEHTRFEADLGETASIVAGMLVKVLLPLPADLEALRAELEEERRALVEAAPTVAEAPEEYVDSFTRDAAAAFGQVQEFAGFAQDLMRMTDDGAAGGVEE